MRSYGSARDVSPEDYKPVTALPPVGTVKALQDAVARLEHRSDCLEERIAELETTIGLLNVEREVSDRRRDMGCQS